VSLFRQCQSDCYGRNGILWESKQMSNSLNWNCIYSKRKHTLIFAGLTRNLTFGEWGWIRALCPFLYIFLPKAD
jgi:hypothetical protein